MNFSMSERQTYWRERVIAFMDQHVYPAIPTYTAQMKGFGENRWQVVPVVEELKAIAKTEGLWNLFLPVDSLPPDSPYRGAGLTNLEYAVCAEQMGRVGFASEVFNCSAPDTGNMEVLARYGSAEHKAKWLQPLRAGEIRSAFLMTEPDVASSDATNIQTSIRRDGDHYVINGRKWWSSGVGDPRCKLAIVMGKTDPSAPSHSQQSQILVELDTPGIEIVRMLPVFGFDDAPHGHAEVVFHDVRVPAENILLGAKLSEYHTGYRAFSREILEKLDLAANSDDFVFDNQMLAQILWHDFTIGEVSCPTKYFPEASSINLRRSIKYGFGCLSTGLRFRFAKWGLADAERFAGRNGAKEH